MIKLVNILLQITEFGKLIESVSSLYSNHTNSIETDKMKRDFRIFSKYFSTFRYDMSNQSNSKMAQDVFFVRSNTILSSKIYKKVIFKVSSLFRKWSILNHLQFKSLRPFKCE